MSADSILRITSFGFLSVAVPIFGTGFAFLTKWHHPLPKLSFGLFLISGLFFFASGWIFAISQGLKMHEIQNIDRFEQRLDAIEADNVNINNDLSKIVQTNDSI